MIDDDLLMYSDDDACGEDLGDFPLDIPSPISEEYDCFFCGRIFPTEHGLKIHIRVCPKKKIK